MRIPPVDFSVLTRLPKTALLIAAPVVAFVTVLGVTLANGGSGSGSGSNGSSAVVIATVGVEASETSQVKTIAPTATTVPAANRASCTQIQGTPYQSDAERDWYAANCGAKPTSTTTSGTPVPTATKGATTSAAPQQAAAQAPAAAPAPVAAAIGNYVSGAAPGAVADELMLRRLGVDGPVHTSVVGSDGAMGNPDGKDDIVWYDFSAYSGLGGYPGMGGNAVLAGHVDYHPHYLAVFWYLRDAVPGDVIDYYTASGAHLQYTVDWNIDAQPDADFSSYVAQTGADIMTVITCDGVFNPDTGHYDHRSVVRAHRTA